MANTGRKRPRETADVNTDLVAIYEDLASENGEVRLKAASRLFSIEFEDAELEKVLKRLFRGLCSGRKAARLGFSVALTEFLSVYTVTRHRFSSKDIVQILKEQTEPPPGATGQELRDYYFGRIFAAEAIIKCKVLIVTDSLTSWRDLADLILDLYLKKQWLREECGWVLAQALSTFKGTWSGSKFAAEVFLKVNERRLHKSLEGIALTLTAQVAGLVNGATCFDMFDTDYSHYEAEKNDLLLALRGTIVSSDEVVQNANATWSNKLHFGWIVIFEALKRKTSERKRPSSTASIKQSPFLDMWQEFVDGYLFASSASEQRKYWGFLMVQHFIRDEEFGNSLFGPNFLRCFSNQLAKSDRHLHGIATKTMKMILSAAEEDKTGQFATDLVTSLLRAEGSQIDFDKVTKTKFLEKLLAKASPECSSLCVDTLTELMHNQIPKSRAPSQFRVAGADFMLNVVKNWKGSKYSNKETQDDGKSTMYQVIEVLTQLAYLDGLQTPTGCKASIPEFDRQTRDTFRARLLSVLSHLMTQTKDASEMPAMAAHILCTADKKNMTPPILDSDEAILKGIENTGKLMVKCGDLSDDRFSDEDRQVWNAFRLLFAFSIIQAFSGDADAVNIMDELSTAFRTLHSGINDEEEEEESFTAVIEIILSLIAKPSVLFRRLGKEVFAAFTNGLGHSGLQPMFEVLQKQESLAGQQELFDAGDGEVEKEGVDSDVEEDDDDDEDNAGSGSNNADSAAEEEAAADDDEQVIDFENKLAAALGTHRANVELEIGNDADTDEEMMDDDQMEALDPMMSNMFKERKTASNKKENKNAKETITQFKSKILELLEIFVQKEAVNEINHVLVLDVVDSCLDAILATKSKQVSGKAASVIKMALNAYKLQSNSEPQRRILRQAKKRLAKFHAAVGSSNSNVHLRACSQASLLCAKMILNNGGAIERIWKEYSKTGARMASTNAKIHAGLFQDWFNWLTTAKLTLSKRSKLDD